MAGEEEEVAVGDEFAEGDEVDFVVASGDGAVGVGEDGGVVDAGGVFADHAGDEGGVGGGGSGAQDGLGAGIVAAEPAGDFGPQDDSWGWGVLRAGGRPPRSRRRAGDPGCGRGRGWVIPYWGHAWVGGRAGLGRLLGDPGGLAVPLRAGPVVAGFDIDVGLKEDGVGGGGRGRRGYPAREEE